MTGEVLGPFDPGAVWFETPLHVCGGDLLRLQRVADLILDEAHAGWERLQRALAFMQPNGLAVYRRFMESGVLPRQTPALGLAGGVDTPAYLGDGGATTSNPLAGLHVDDSKNGTMLIGFSGGASTANYGVSGDGWGGGFGGGRGSSQPGAGGGGYGTAGGDAGNYPISSHGEAGRGGYEIPPDTIWQALRRNTFTRDILQFGAGGGATAQNRLGAAGGDAYIGIVHGVLTTHARTLTGRNGANVVNGYAGAGGAGGLWLGIANRIAYGSGTINVSGGASGTSNGPLSGNGGNGRVVQVYFDSKADDLQVTNGVQSQFRILRSVPIGQNTFL